MICSRCGSNLPDNVSFCQNCGAQFEPVAAPQPQEQGAYYNEGAPVYNQAEAPQYETYAEQTVTEETPKKKKSVGSVIFTVIAIVLVVALAGLNVLQFLNTQAVTEELDAANEAIADLEADNEGLTEERDTLSADLSTLQTEHDALVQTAAGYEDQIAQLQSENSELNSTVGTLEEQVSAYAPAAEYYYAIADFLSSDAGYGYRADDKFYTDTNILVMYVGETVTINATFEQSGSIYYAWDDGIVGMNGLGFADNVCPIEVTAVGPGISTIEFTNDVDSVAFEVLVVVIG